MIGCAPNRNAGDFMARTTITLGRRPVGIADMVAIARDGAKVALGSAALRRLKRSRAVVDTLAAGQKPIYGLNTGLGAGVDTRLTAAEMNDFQARVLIARSVGIGPRFSTAEVRALLAAGQRQPAAQVLHRLRGVAANLGAAEVARLSAGAEHALQQDADSLALAAALRQLEQALEVVTRTARSLARPAADPPASHSTPSDMLQKLAELQSLLQNNNLRALDAFRALRPALAAATADALGEAVDTLNFKAALGMVEDLLQRKESA